MDYFNDLLATFLDLDRSRILAVYAGSENTQNSSKIINLCSEDEGWGWVINDRITFFGWTVPLKEIKFRFKVNLYYVRGDGSDKRNSLGVIIQNYF